MPHDVSKSKSPLKRPLRARITRAKVVLAFVGLIFLWFLSPSSSQRPSIDRNHGLLKSTSESSRFAVATFLTGNGGQSSTDNDGSGPNFYFIATRILAYLLLHDPKTRCNEAVDFVVLVAPNVPESARKQLKADGAVVIEAKKVPLSWWIRTGVTRWKDQFMKLRLLELTQYDRLLFIDADTLIRGRLDGIFNELEIRNPTDTLTSRLTKADEARLPAQYVFAARSNNELTGERDHPFPPLNTGVFSAGFWVAAPSHELYAYLLSVMSHYRRFDPHTMEQSLLNYAFRRDGPMPWREIHYKWSATWPNSRDVEGQVVTLHEKFWATGPQELRNLWWEEKQRMEQYFSQQP